MGKYRIYLPAGLTCTQDEPCTLQWLFMTGNSQDSYPEAFRNCADFKISQRRRHLHPLHPILAAVASTFKVTLAALAWPATTFATRSPSFPWAIIDCNVSCVERGA